LLEKIFEGILWQSRFIVLLAVIFSLLGGIILFIVASVDIFQVGAYVFKVFFMHSSHTGLHEDMVIGIIGAIDLYLIAVVMLIFSFGIYELFISKIDLASEANSILEIHSLDQLKDKIAKVIIMVLVVNFFQRVLHTKFTTPLQMLYLALSIAALALSLYFIGKIKKH